MQLFVRPQSANCAHADIKRRLHRSLYNLNTQAAGRQMYTRHATYTGYQDVAMPKQNAFVSTPRYVDDADNAAIHQLGQLALL